MSDQYVAEIRLFAFNFAPRGWALCNGQLMSISQNTALFSLLGTYYGGDGKTTFGLPNLQDRAPIHQGQGPGRSIYDLGQTGGTDAVTLLESEIPSHQHRLQASPDPGDNTVPGPTTSLAGSIGGNVYAGGSPPLAPMAGDSLLVTGGSGPHNNLQPYLTCNYSIALEGIFPPRG